jgi:glycosyltransferase involved in cell wall biosynthesis
VNQTDQLPLVTIVTPVHNGSKYIERLIRSVADQGYPGIEHIIIDDGSTDDGATTAALEGHLQLRWWSHPKAGQYPTMNEGLMAARGDLVCFVSADDMLVPGAVDSAVKFMQAHPGLDGVYGTYAWIDENDGPHRAQPIIHTAPLKAFRYFTFITHCSLFLKRTRLLESKLFFDEGLQYLGDYEWIVRMIDSGIRLGFVGRVFSLIRYHDEQASNQFPHEISAERRAVFKRLGVSRSLYQATYWAIYGLSAAQRLFEALLQSGPRGAFQLISDWQKRRRG